MLSFLFNKNAPAPRIEILANANKPLPDFSPERTIEFANLVYVNHKRDRSLKMAFLRTSIPAGLPFMERKIEEFSLGIPPLTEEQEKNFIAALEDKAVKLERTAVMAMSHLFQPS